MPIVRLADVQQFAAINLTADPGYDKGNRIIPQVAAIVLTWSLTNGKVARNILHGRYSGAFHGSAAECNSMLTGLTTPAQWTTLAGFLIPTASLAFVSIRDLGQKDAPVISSTGAAHPGTSTGTALPDEVAAVITLRTPFIGRQNRGRVYVPGWATTAIGAGGVMAAGAVSALSGWASIISGVLTAQGYEWGIGHFHRLEYTSAAGVHHDERPAGLVPIQAVEVHDNHWDTMRRRGLK